MDTVLICLIFYLCGSIPFGLIFLKLFGGGDIRKKGSGNIGATNALRVGGKKLGGMTLIFDCLKAIVPLLILQTTISSYLMLALAGVCLVIGHIFPMWLGFKGGKGVATTLAVLLILTPKIAVIFLLTWAIIFKVTKIVSLASITAITVTAILSLFLLPWAYMIMAVICWILILFSHRQNIKRLIAGKEFAFK